MLNSLKPYQNSKSSHQRNCCRFTSSNTNVTTSIACVLYHICICLTIILTFFNFIHIAQTRRLQPCEFAGQLYILDVPKQELPLWSCIAEYESRFNTDVIGKRNLDGSFDYGIFQISDKFWCQSQNKSLTNVYSFNECNIDCNDLLLDDITAAVRCARIIQKQQGWSAWSVYGVYCNDTTISLSEIEQCFE